MNAPAPGHHPDGRVVVPTDLRLLPAALGAWAGAAWAVAHPVTLLVAGAVASVLAAVGLLGLARRRPRLVPVALALTGATLALGCTAVHQQVRLAGEAGPALADTAVVSMDVRVSATPRRVQARFTAADRWAVRVRAQTLGRGLEPTGRVRTPLLVIGGPDWGQVEPGQRYRIRARLIPADPGDDVVALVRSDGPGPELAGESGPARVTGTLRQGLLTATAGLAPDAAGLLPGLVVGDTRRLDPDLETAMQDTGLTHLTAVSGANITIVTATLLWLLRWVRMPRGARLLVAFAGLAGFVLLAGPEPSVLRAGVMGTVGLIALASARPGAAVPALCVAVLVLCAADPWLSRAAGFALSVLATAGIVLLARPLSRWAAPLLTEPVAVAVAVPLAAQAFCGPVILLLDDGVPLTAVPANMVAGPLVAPATVLGLAAALLSPVWGGGAALTAWVAQWPVLGVAVVARTAAALPGAVLGWPQGPGGAAALAVLTLLTGLTGWWLTRRLRGGPVPDRRAWLVLGTGVVAVALLVGVLGPVGVRLLSRWPAPGWQLVVCDVGQGSAAVVSTGPGSAVVLDAGPQDSGVDGCLRRLGVDRIDLLVLTHFHADHVDGLSDVLGNRQVGEVLVSPLPEPATAVRQVQADLAALDIPSRVPGPGERGTVGRVGYEILAPTRLPAAGGESDGEGSAVNNASLILHLRTPGLRAVVLGDSEPEEQFDVERVLAARPDLVPVDAVVVAHHGSARQRWSLYERLGAPVSLISVGADNDYGHPAPATLNTLGATSLVLCTDTCGDLAVLRGAEGDLVAVCRHGRPRTGGGRSGADCGRCRGRLRRCRVLGEEVEHHAGDEVGAVRDRDMTQAG